jgi:hypothetical protein
MVEDRLAGLRAQLAQLDASGQQGAAQPSLFPQEHEDQAADVPTVIEPKASS